MPPGPRHRPGLSCEGNSGVGVRGRTSCSVSPGVRIKTFFAHVVFIFRLIVSGKRFSTHEKTENVTAETLTTPLLDFSQREEFSYSSFKECWLHARKCRSQNKSPCKPRGMISPASVFLQTSDFCLGESGGFTDCGNRQFEP